MLMDMLEVDGVYVRKLYDGRFEESMTSQVYERTYSFLCDDRAQEQMRSILGSDEVWIKPNLGNARPPETGCITHPVTIKACIDCLSDFSGFRKPIKIVETKTYHKGEGISEIVSRVPPSERAFLKKKLEGRDPSQDIHDFGFNLMLELSGINKLAEDYRDGGLDIGILNLSKEPVMRPEEGEKLGYELEQLLGKEVVPTGEIRKRLLANVPRVLAGRKKIGLVSLAVPKTHDELEVQITATMKNIALGLFPEYKAFMHKDLAKAVVYHFALWKRCLGDRVFGIVSGPYGMDGAGPIFGRVADFPYIVAGSDLLKVDCATTVLMFGDLDLLSKLKPFKHAQDKVGHIPHASELKRLLPHALHYEPYPYELTKKG